MQQSGSQDMTYWLEYFGYGLAIEVDKVKSQVLKLSKDLKLKEQLGRQVSLSERQIILLEILQHQGEITSEQAQQALPNVSTDTILRDIKESSILEYKHYKIVYKNYASLYFIFGIDTFDNELASLELIHLFVETMDKYFGSVCELDVVYNFYKVYTVLDELLIGGEIVETSKTNILKKLKEIEFYE